MVNPFITSGYVDAEHFCDRVNETEQLLGLLQNGNNITLISPRRIGKTDLVRHCFAQPGIQEQYYTFVIDIYDTRSLSEFVNRFGKAILETLKPKGKQLMDKFLAAISSIRAGITYDIQGNPSWTVGLSEISNPSVTLDEIFHYLQTADKPCLVAIDEFQQITKYAENSIEATLRTHIQYCSNAHFIFSGSQRHLMGAMFTSPSRPFYQSVTVLNLQPLALDKYATFCQHFFTLYGKELDSEVVSLLYNQFDGITFYMQKMMNILFMQTADGQCCTTEMLYDALTYVLDFSAPTYEDLLYQLPTKQRDLIITIGKVGKVRQVTSGKFAKEHGLLSPSSVKSAVNGLLDKDLLTEHLGVYQVYDKFLELWIQRTY